MTEPFADGTRVLHIGPFKTGTTTVQAAFHQNRPALAEQGVHYAGSRAQPMAAALAVAVGRANPNASVEAGERRWRRLVEEIDAADARLVMISSEFFSDAPAERIPRIVDDLGRERTEVVLTLRPLARILASQWQQYMQNRPSVRYDDALDYPGWLRAVLDDPDGGEVTPSFWSRHRHDRLVQRWVEAVGADRLTVIVVDESDKRMLMRTFEELLALRDGTLVPREIGANRSLTHPEILMLRRFNEAFLAAGGSPVDYTGLVRFGAVRHLQARTPLPQEARLLTPGWAVERACEISAEMVTAIRGTGVAIIGDPDSLADPRVAVERGENDPEEAVPDEVVARFMAGLVRQVAEIPAGPAPADRKVGPIEEGVRRTRALYDGPGDDPGPGPMRRASRRLRRRLRSRVREED